MCNISQLLIYNCTKGTHHPVKTDAVRHNKERETPFPLYHGLKLHRNGRSKKQIEIDHEQGISVSYNRIMEVKRSVARAVCARHTQDGVVLPTNSRLNVSPPTTGIITIAKLRETSHWTSFTDMP